MPVGVVVSAGSESATVDKRPVGAQSMGREAGDAVTTCRICGDLIRDGEDTVKVADDSLHVSCVDAPNVPKRRSVGAWAAFGSKGQMAMGVTQRDTPMD